MRIHAGGLKDSDGVIFPTVPTGLYKCRISSVKLGETSEKAKYPGSPMLLLQAKVIAGEEHADHTFLFNVILPSDNATEEYNSKAVARLKRLAIACGIEIDSDDFDTEDLMGSNLILDVSQQTKDGKPFNSVDDQLPMD